MRKIRSKLSYVNAFWRPGIVIGLALAALLFARAGTAYGQRVFYRGHADGDKSVHVDFTLRGPLNPRDPDLLMLKDARVENFDINNFQFECHASYPPGAPPNYYRDSAGYDGNIDVERDGDFAGSGHDSGTQPYIHVDVQGQFSHQEARADGWFKVHYKLPDGLRCATPRMDWTAHPKASG